MEDSGMYARKESDGFYSLRQVRFKLRLAQGKEHPHDICAVARSVAELHSICDKYWPDADYSEVETA